MLFNKNLKKKLLVSLFLVFSLVLFAACTSNSGSTTEETPTAEAGEHEMEDGEQEMEDGEHEMEDGEHEMEDGEHEMEDGEHEHASDERIPNPDGVAVSILSPADGATFAVGDEVVVEIQVDNFALGEDGSHWHVYVDGTSWGMITGGNTSESLRGLEAGEHEVAVYLAGGDHVEFEQGDSIHITVE